LRPSVNPGCTVLPAGVAMLMSVAKSLNAMVSLSKAIAEKLAAIAHRATNRMTRAYAEYAFHEVSKLNRLSVAVVNELGLSTLGGEEDAAELLGEAYVKLATQLQEVLDRLAKRVSKAALVELTEVAEPLLRLTAVHLMACAKVVEDYSHKPSAARALRRSADDVLHMASKMRLMRSALRLKARTYRREGLSS